MELADRQLGGTAVGGGRQRLPWPWSEGGSNCHSCGMRASAAWHSCKVGVAATATAAGTSYTTARQSGRCARRCQPQRWGSGAPSVCPNSRTLAASPMGIRRGEAYNLAWGIPGLLTLFNTSPLWIGIGFVTPASPCTATRLTFRQQRLLAAVSRCQASGCQGVNIGGQVPMAQASSQTQSTAVLLLVAAGGQSWPSSWLRTPAPWPATKPALGVRCTADLHAV